MAKTRSAAVARVAGSGRTHSPPAVSPLTLTTAGGRCGGTTITRSAVTALPSAISARVASTRWTCVFDRKRIRRAAIVPSTCAHTSGPATGSDIGWGGGGPISTGGRGGEGGGGGFGAQGDDQKMVGKSVAVNGAPAPGQVDRVYLALPVGNGPRRERPAVARAFRPRPPAVQQPEFAQTHHERGDGVHHQQVHTVAGRAAQRRRRGQAAESGTEDEHTRQCHRGHFNCTRSGANAEAPGGEMAGELLGQPDLPGADLHLSDLPPDIPQDSLILRIAGESLQHDVNLGQVGLAPPPLDGATEPGERLGPPP